MPVEANANAPEEEQLERRPETPSEAAPAQQADDEEADGQRATSGDEDDLDFEDEGLDRPAPTAMEIAAFARYLGMDPVTDCHLLWIAEEALSAPLPDEYEEHLDEEGKVYYYNTETDVSQREHPLDSHYRDLYLQMKQHEETDPEGGEGEAAAEAAAEGKQEESAQDGGQAIGGGAKNERTAPAAGVTHRKKLAAAGEAAKEAAAGPSGEAGGAAAAAAATAADGRGAGEEQQSERRGVLARARTVTADLLCLIYLFYYATQKPQQYAALVVVVWLYLFFRVTRAVLARILRLLLAPDNASASAPAPYKSKTS
eukprot:tig00000970_g5847.t1